MKIAIASGKGGTGKTTITASLASLWKNIVIADCDVDAADLHLILHPDIGKNPLRSCCHKGHGGRKNGNRV